jgi:hypothetical protein
MNEGFSRDSGGRSEGARAALSQTTGTCQPNVRFLVFRARHAVPRLASSHDPPCRSFTLMLLTLLLSICVNACGGIDHWLLGNLDKAVEGPVEILDQ